MGIALHVCLCRSRLLAPLVHVRRIQVRRYRLRILRQHDVGLRFDHVVRVSNFFQHSSSGDSFSLTFADVATNRIFVTYIRFRKGLDAQGINRTLLPYRAPLGIYLAWYGLIFACLILFFNGFGVFIHVKSVGFDSSTFITSYFPSMAFSACTLRCAP